MRGKPAEPAMLVNVPNLVTAYYTEVPDPSNRKLAGETIDTVITQASGYGAPIGGLKVAAESGWFAARPSGTENVCKIYAESFRGADHLLAASHILKRMKTKS